jgi:hypothetical protein
VGITARGPDVFARGNPIGKAIANSASRTLSEGNASAQDAAIQFDPGNSE